MNRAIRLPQYSDVTNFTKPDGVTEVRIDKASGLPADATCPNDYVVAFLDSTIPGSTCSRMSDSGQSVVDILTGNTPASNNPQPESPDSGDPAIPPTRKRNFLKRLFNPNGGSAPTPPPQ